VGVGVIVAVGGEVGVTVAVGGTGDAVGVGTMFSWREQDAGPRRSAGIKSINMIFCSGFARITRIFPDSFRENPRLENDCPN
jgi:hypothetical protein